MAFFLKTSILSQNLVVSSKMLPMTYVQFSGFKVKRQYRALYDKRVPISKNFDLNSLSDFNGISFSSLQSERVIFDFNSN